MGVRPLNSSVFFNSGKTGRQKFIANQSAAKPEYPQSTRLSGSYYPPPNKL